MESIVMSKEKQLQIHTISNLSSGKLTFKEAMNLIGKSEELKHQVMKFVESELMMLTCSML